MEHMLFCLDATSDAIVDFTLAPNLLYYAFIPIAILILFFGGWVYFKDKNTISKIFLALSAFIFIWILLQILNWIALPVALVAFTWELLFLIDPIIYILSFYFVFLSFYNQAPNFVINTLVLFPLVILSFLFPTFSNFAAFDLLNCENIDGWAWNISYGYQLLLVVGILATFLVHSRLSPEKRKQNLMITLATLVFLTVFWLTNFLGDYTSVYDINLIGPIGMLVMVVILAVSIVRYQVFKIKILLPQVLVILLLFLNFGILFIQDISLIRIVMIFTILLVAIIGWIMIKSVKQVEQQRAELETSNNEQEILIHFITHQIKGFFTKSRNIFDTLSDNREAFSPSLNRLIDEGLRSDKEGVELVENILHASNLRTGKIKYADERFELNPLVESLIKELQSAATAKNLTINYYAPTAPITVKADQARIKDLVKNLIQNAVLYTFKGGVNVSLTQKGDEVELIVKDTGIGLTKSDKSRLFQSGGRGEESVKYNTGSTGYGLFIAKKVVDNYKGFIWAESEGRDKGSKFTAVLPIVQPLVK